MHLIAVGVAVVFFTGVYIAGISEAEMAKRRRRKPVPLPSARLVRRRT